MIILVTIGLFGTGNDKSDLTEYEEDATVELKTEREPVMAYAKALPAA